MQPTRKQKVFAAIAGLALAALVFYQTAAILAAPGTYYHG